MSQEIQQRELERASSALIDLGVRTVKRNPIKVGAYVIGLLFCYFFNGFKTSPENFQKYEDAISRVNFSRVESLANEVQYWQGKYYRSKGWFTCDNVCKSNQNQYQLAIKEYELAKSSEENKIIQAKNNLGIFSEHGVAETRDLFWQKFSRGKEFASRQSKWDAFFITLGAMGRDESIIEYALRLLLSVLFNLTLGVCTAVLFFVFSLWGLIRSYKPSILEMITFFVLASLSAISFALTWLLVLYTAAAGTVFVGGRMLATTIRIQDGRTGERRRVRTY